MNISLHLEHNLEQGEASSEWRFYLVFEEKTTLAEIEALFHKKGFQDPEIDEKDKQKRVFLNKRTPEPYLVQAAQEAGQTLLENYSIVQALESIKEVLGTQFELDSNALETLKRSKSLADKELNDLKNLLTEELTEDYYSPFLGIHMGLTEEYIQKLEPFIKKSLELESTTAVFDTQQHRKDYVEAMEPKLKAILVGLEEKIGAVKLHHLKEAQTRAQALLFDLNQEVTEYLTHLLDSKQKISDLSAAFEERCRFLITEAKPLLERDLSWGVYLSNLLKKIANLLLYMLSFGKTQGFFKLIPSQSAQAVEEAAVNLNEILALNP